MQSTEFICDCKLVCTMSIVDCRLEMDMFENERENSFSQMFNHLSLPTIVTECVTVLNWKYVCCYCYRWMYINFCIQIVSSTQGCNGLFTFELQSNNFIRSIVSPPLPFTWTQHINMIIYSIVQQRLENQLAMKWRRLGCVSVTNFMNLNRNGKRTKKRKWVW